MDIRKMGHQVLETMNPHADGNGPPPIHGTIGGDKGGHWIASATSNSHGQFRRKAEAAGMSTRAYANKEASAPGKTGKQARLAKTLMGMH